MDHLCIINVKAPGWQKWQPVRTGILGTFLTGSLFSLVILPCATSVLASILSYSAGRDNALYSSSLLFTYGAGIGAPLFVFGSSIGLVSSLRPVTR
jgi:cytochrome c biogenesis protein CcdA